MDTDGATASFTLLDLTLLPMEEESGERPDSAFIPETERVGRMGLKASQEKRKLKRSGGKNGEIEPKTLKTPYMRRKENPCGKANLEVLGILSSSYPVSGTQGTNGTLRTTLPAIVLRPKGFQRILKTSVLSNKNSL
ncbi:hypothetical protein F2Q70_00012226 [Brassica cretica]|uniref:Uncharacterized protein n=1 Tax=Brassica cretica TaxID=69181 RepID=A0A8S9M0X6_BRACR|nr:hypothetical protein F2Q70_00012226 [Brassica cretica]